MHAKTIGDTVFIFGLSYREEIISHWAFAGSQINVSYWKDAISFQQNLNSYQGLKHLLVNSITKSSKLLVTQYYSQTKLSNKGREILQYCCYVLLKNSSIANMQFILPKICHSIHYFNKFPNYLYVISFNLWLEITSLYLFVSKRKLNFSKSIEMLLAYY